MANNRSILAEQLLALQRYAIDGVKPNISYDDCDWQMLKTLSYMNKCSMLINSAVNKDIDFFGIAQKTLTSWNTSAQQEFINSYAKFAYVKKVLIALNDNGIRGIVLKGSVLSALYPNFFSRFSCDLDIKFDKEDKEKIHELFTKDLGFNWNEADSKENVYLYFKDILLIEAHFTLWEDYHGENIDILVKEKLDDPKTLVEVPVTEDLKVWTLGPTEHLILQMFHIVKHYIVEGIESRYFTDITLFINRYKDDIDFERFFRVFSEMHFDNFCRMYFTECINRFGMDESVLAPNKRLLPEDEMAFLTDIVFLGKQDINDHASFSLLGILSPYVNGGKETASSKKGRALQALFPSVKNIDDKYAYCKKFPVLLPVAWVHRAIRTIYFRLTKGDKVYGAKDKLKSSEYRINMMKNSHIL